MKATKPVSGYLAVRGNIYHTVLGVYINGKRHCISRTTGLPVKNNLRKAQKILEERKREYDEHGLAGVLSLEERKVASSTLLADYMLKWLTRKKDVISDITYRNYASMINGHIRRYFDPQGITIASLTPQVLEDFLEDLSKKGCNSTTRQRYYALISQCTKYAVRKDLIEKNPMDKVDRPKKSKFKASFYSREESTKLLECCKDDLCYIPILLATYYGLRRSEALGLQWSSVDFEHNLLHIDHKAAEFGTTGPPVLGISADMKTETSCRTLPLIPFVRDVLLRHREQQKEYQSFFGKAYNQKWLNCVCVTPIGDLIRPDYLTCHFSRILKSNNLRHIRFHDLRHSCASLLVAQGIPMKQIQLWLGHSNYSTTADIYSHLSTDALQESAQYLGQILAPTEKGVEENS